MLGRLAVALGSQDTLEVHDLPPAILAGQEAQIAEESTAVSPVKSAVSNTELAEKKKVVVDVLAPPVPTLAVVSTTGIVAPALAAAGALSEEITRSGVGV